MFSGYPSQALVSVAGAATHMPCALCMTLPVWRNTVSDRGCCLGREQSRSRKTAKQRTLCLHAGLSSLGRARRHPRSHDVPSPGAGTGACCMPQIFINLIHSFALLTPSVATCTPRRSRDNALRARACRQPARTSMRSGLGASPADRAQPSLVAMLDTRLALFAPARRLTQRRCRSCMTARRRRTSRRCC
jgi:hypothetical protein